LIACLLDTGQDLETALEFVPNEPAVFLVWPAEGQPYLGRTAMLRRRLKRLLGERSAASRLLNLRSVARRVEYWRLASRLASARMFYELARRHFPENYGEHIKLRLPPFVKLLLANEFPRTQVTQRLSASQALHYGPFRTRASAEKFEQELLDLFQIRRCQEDLNPSPDHPGCIYGEMARCLRPCQEVVGVAEYQSEVRRVVTFLDTDGGSLVESIRAARDRLSQELNFEEARRQHQRLEQVEQLMRGRDDLAGEVQRLHGIAVLPSVRAGCVDLHFLLAGVWADAVVFRVAATAGQMIPLDRRLRELVAKVAVPKVSLRERQEHIALLARWYYSSWRDGEWLPFRSLDELPYRKLVRAISRVACGATGAAQ